MLKWKKNAVIKKVDPEEILSACERRHNSSETVLFFSCGIYLRKTSKIFVFQMEIK